MPEVALAPLLEALIWALLGIVIVNVLRQLIVAPINSASRAVSGVPVIGGTLAWAIGQIALAITLLLDGLWWIADKGKQDATYYWNLIVYSTANAFFPNLYGVTSWVNNNWQSVNYVLNNWNALWTQAWVSIPNAITTTWNDLQGLHHWIDGVQMPWIHGIGDDLAGLHRWIDSVQVPWISGIGDDLAGLHRWIDANLVRRSELAQAEADVLARVQAIALPIEAAISDIENSPCMKVCEPLGDLGQFIQGLEDAGLLAIMLELVNEARTNPNQLRSTLDGTLVPILRDAASSLQLGIPD